MSAPRSDRPGSPRVLAQPPVTSAAVQRISFSPQNGFCSNVTGTFPRTCLGPDECCWHCPAQIGQGVFRKFDIREGFSLFVTDCRIRETWLFEHEESDSPDYLMFGFFLSGHSSSRYESLPESLELRGGQQGIFFFPLNRGMSRVRHESPLRHLSFRLSLEQAHFYFGDSLRQAPTALHNAIGRHGRDSFVHVREINQQMEQALSQVLHCPYQGMTRRLFLESRALELLAYQLEQLPPAPAAGNSTWTSCPAPSARISSRPWATPARDWRGCSMPSTARRRETNTGLPCASTTERPSNVNLKVSKRWCGRTRPWPRLAILAGWRSNCWRATAISA